MATRPVRSIPARTEKDASDGFLAVIAEIKGIVFQFSERQVNGGRQGEEGDLIIIIKHQFRQVPCVGEFSA